jgi:hypothetical protein
MKGENMDSTSRFIRNFYVDGHPILDRKTGSFYGNYNKNDLIELLNCIAEKAERATPVENGKNRYGVDVSYFRKTINRELNRPLSDFRPDELARVFARLSKTADPDVMSEPEFRSK